MTSDKCILSNNMRPCTGDKVVVVGSGAMLFRYWWHISSPLWFYLKLKIILVVPNIQKNILSISQLTFYHPCLCEFSSIDFAIKDKMIGRILNKGWGQGMFILSHIQLVYTSLQDSSKLMNKFGMLTLAILTFHLVWQLQNKGTIKVSNKQPIPFVYESCTMAKASQLPFISINKRSSSSFELVHF